MTKLHGLLGVRSALGAMAALSAAVAFSAPARADGGIPRGYGILFEPGNSSHILIHSQFWGLFDQRNGGPWSLLCSQAFGGRALDADNYPTVLAKGGRILVASAFSGLIVSDDGCMWKQIDAFNGEPVQVVAPMDAAGVNFIAVTVKGENGGVTSRAYTSTDRGDTWTAVKGTMDPNVSIQGAGVAPSDSKRIYLVGVTINGGPRVLEVSTDGGDTFKSLPIGAMTDYDPSEPATLTVPGIAPDNPDTVFVRVDGSDAPGSMTPDELWASQDAGMTWVKTYQPTGDLPGFTFSADGKSVLIGSPADGIKQASLADAASGKADAFQQIYTNAIWGLTLNDGKIYAGNDDYGMKPPFMFGVSTDGGRTFTGMMGHCDVGFPQCDPSSTMEMVCREQFDRQGGWQTDYLAMCNGNSMGGAAGASQGGAATAGAAGAAAPSGGTGNVTTTPGGGVPNVGQGGTAATIPGSTGGAMANANGGGNGGGGCSCTIGATRFSDSELAGIAVVLGACGVRLSRRRSKKQRRS